MDERVRVLLREARKQLELERQRRNAPIAVVGIGCRLPGGVSSPSAYWDLLCAGVDATGEVPLDRWNAEAFFDADPNEPGKAYTKRGAFLGDVSGFEPAFFGISPREAEGMDPQQRLLLEVAWEALEDAGIVADTLRGSATGVWIGMCVQDYARRSLLSGDPKAIDAYNALGNTSSIGAGRLSYVLDLRGPCVQLDTACSSSLVALHEACNSLRSGECDVALVGGVNLMLAPEMSIALSKLRALSPDGRCKTFDASADGYGRGEGCGIVVLQRLDDALSAGRRVYASVQGSAVNHDGHSNGLTAPNGLAQEAVIRKALAGGEISPAAVTYVEAHGTGTLLGDPIEVLALSHVLTESRPADAPLWLGSVKTNLGHLEAAAGVAALIKVALCLFHGSLVPTLHFQKPNPKIPWSTLPVRVVTSKMEWPSGSPRVAGVSSFGISGTNAHVVLQRVPAQEAPAPARRRAAELVVLSAKTPQALAAVAGRLREHLLAHPEFALGDLAYSLVTTRSLHEQRLTLSVPSRDALLEALEQAAQGQTPPGAQRGVVTPARGPLAWLFTGQGAQQLGMGRELHTQWAEFRQAFDEVCALFDAELEVPLREVMWAEPGSERASWLDRTGYTQPALFVLEWSLACLWRSWGVEPDLLLGHSIGEIVAATVAGVFGLKDAVRLVAARARLMQALPAGGAMVSIAATEALVRQVLAPYAESVSVAAVNGPSSVVIAGAQAHVEALARVFEQRGAQTKRLPVSHAFHSPLMDPMLSAFREVAQSLSYRAPRLALVSDTTGERVGPEVATAEYWVRHVRETVRFAAAVQTLARSGAQAYLELGPRATLLGLVSASLEQPPSLLLPSLRAKRPECEAVLEAVGGMVARGGVIDWNGVFPERGRALPLPTYPWQRERYWIDQAAVTPSGATRAHWPLAGSYRALPGGGFHHVLAVGVPAQSYLQDHVVHGAIVLPGAFYVSVMLACAAARWPDQALELDDVDFTAPLFLDPGRLVELDVLLTPAENGTSQHIELATKTGSDAGWVTHARATASPASALSSAPPELERLRAATRSASPDKLIEKLSRARIDWGPQWRWITEARAGAGAASSEIAPPSADSRVEAPLHPILLDNAFGTAGFIDQEESAGDAPQLPFAIRRVRWLRVPNGRVRCGVLRHSSVAATPDIRAHDLWLWDETGEIVGTIERFATRAAPTGLFLRGRAPAAASAPFHTLAWNKVDGTATSPLSGRWLLLGEPGARELLALADALKRQGALARCSTMTEALQDPALEMDHVVCCWDAGRDDAASRAERLISAATTLSQRLLQRQPAARLWWITRSAVAVHSGEEVDPAAAALWGLGRSLLQEHPASRCTLVDLPSDAGLAELLPREFAQGDDETQLAWRGGERHVARMQLAGPAATLPDAANYQLEIRRKGTFDGLELAAGERRAPAPGEIEIEIVATGLNFRDVLNALGLYPGEAGPLGVECSGVVSAVGAGVAHLQVGAAVMAMAPGAFRRFVTLDARLAAPLPSGLSFEQAATVPVAFLTAWYALHDLARLRAGERLLVHAAAGGVGMAAVQLAHWIGAEVLATASPPKWATVRGLGVEHIASSRDLEFARTFRAATAGVDVVLNSLAGEFIDASLSLLSAGGRFLEMGKIDVREASDVAARHPGVSYQAFELTTIPPDRIAEMLAAIVEGFREGHLTALPVRSFALSEAEAAFRFMAQARHVGKIALLPARRLQLEGSSALITGGLGALGLEVARTLAEQGVRQLVLTGRRGLEAEGAREAVTALEALGASVTVAAVDVTDAKALARVLEALPSEYPLRTIVHAAGILDDGIFLEQTPERLARVLAPKVLGAWNLHQLSQTLALDHFVLFSSLAGTLGSPGQSGYAAANAFLDGLAALRRAQGLPAISMAWGPWSGSGFAARLDAAQQARLARQGLRMIEPAQGRSFFEQALTRPESQLIVAPLDLRALSASLGADAVPPLWRSLLRASSGRPSALRSDAARSDWARELSALPETERLEAVTHAVCGEVARVLSLPSASQVPADRPLQERGLDSLMAVELRNALGRRAGASLPATLAFDHPTPSAIARYLLTDVLKLTELAPSPPAVAPTIATDEPIAVVGIGCRFPGGVTDMDSFWRLLEGGVDAITEVPKSRWDIDDWYDPDPDAAGKMTTRWGGFLEDLDRFEPGFFGISPREALSIDPQERLLLETTWEAIESAGIQAEALMGSSTGVYMGLCGTEYQTRVMADAEELDAYSLLGTAHSTVVGRLSYWLGLKGPNLPVDTACSSSLVTVHLACQALRNGECTLALAGGANVTLSPEGTVYFSRLRAMSPTGRCHTFSAAADGYVRAEGAGVVLLERLSDARRNGHRVLALVRGSAVNQDGRSNGMTAPNGPSQQMVIRQALSRGGIAPAEVGYVECHGTGTALGDPIEVQALSAVLGQGRAADHPVVLGALKSNVGHMEGAAGVGGLIKAVLTLQHGRIPKSLHFEQPNPHIAWSELPVKVAADALEWPRNGKARIAGVSSFGISGTNAHVVLEEAPEQALPAPAPARSAELVVLSAKTPEALAASAGRLREHLEAHPDFALGDIAHSMVSSRSLHEQRLALSVSSREVLLAALGAAARGETPAGSQRGAVDAAAGKLAWLFTGQGAQELGMGRELYAQWPAFRGAFDEVCELFDAQLDVPLREVMWAEAGSERAGLLDQTGYTQPALFALEWSLACLWRSWGVVPDLLLGHSIGEITAATVAGVFRVADAVRLVAARARLMQALPAGGAMVSIAAAEARVREAWLPYAESVSIAAVNGPSSVVIAGREAQVLALAQRFEQQGVQTRRLSVSHAFHSPLMDPMLEQFRTVAQGLSYQAPRIPLVSDTTGEQAGAEVASAEYWARHVRETVRFATGVQTLARAGAQTYLEIGPRATLLGLVRASAPELTGLLLLPSMRSTRPESEAVLEALGGWVARGGEVLWKGVFPSGGRVLPLPTYPWQRERYWIDAARRNRHGGAASAQHPLIGARLEVAGVDAVYENVLESASPAWLSDHRVQGHTVVPAAALLELIRTAAEQQREGEAQQVTELVVPVPLVLDEREPQRVQVVFTEQGAKASVYARAARAGAAAPWRLHSTARVAAAPSAAPQPLDLSAVRARCTRVLDVEQIYSSFAALGLDYGPLFRGLQAVSCTDSEALAEISLPDAADAEHYGIHPALLDAALHAIAAMLGTRKAVLLPFAVGRFALYRTGATRAFVHVRLHGAPADENVVADLVLATASGEIIAEMLGFKLRPADSTSFARLGVDLQSKAFYRVDWQALELPALQRLSGRWLLIPGRDAQRASAAVAALRRAGAECELTSIEELARAAPADHVVCLWDDERPEAALPVAQRGLAIIKALSAQRARARLWWLTQGAVAVSPGEGASPAMSALWGLGRTLLREQPALSCTLIDLDRREDPASVLARELEAADGESQVAWRDGQRHAARLVRVLSSASTAAARPLRTDGTVVMTGGLGALGVEVAKHFARRGVKHLLLLGRRGLATPGAAAAVAEIEALGARVTVEALDIADRAALARVLETIPDEWPLRGVAHLAAAVDDALLPEQTAERFARVIAPKVTGAWNLHELTAQADLDLFLVFSSVAGTLGSAGQSNYAAANASLDALVSLRRSRGLTGQSLAWGPWAERGLAAQLDANLRTRIARQGIGALSPSQGLELLEQALRMPDALLLVVRLDLPTVAKAFAGSVPPLWRSLLRATQRGRADLDHNWKQELEQLPTEQRLAAVTQVVCTELAQILSLPSAQQVPQHRPLQELGIDSLMELELRSSLGRRSGTELPATLAFDHPTAASIAEYLLTDVLHLAEPRGGAALDGAPSVPSAADGAEFFVVDRIASADTLRADARLDADITPASAAPAIEARSVLLTGATGFLGAFLLAELCQQTRAHITCLIRGASLAQARERIVNNFRRYGLSEAMFEGRISVVLGDLEQPELGLSRGEFRRLADELDAIYSNGVRVSFVATYQRLKPSHINGTQEILRLAAMGRPKVVHHVSSTSAYSSLGYRGLTLSDSQPPLLCEDMVLPYAQCKWVTEAMAREASARGLPVVIYRPSVISGSSVTGAWSTDDLILRTLMGVMELGCLPGPVDSFLDFSPVDYVARSLVCLSQRPASVHRAFNLNHPVGLRWGALAEIIRSLGYDAKIVPHDVWVERIQATRNAALYPLLPFLRARGADGLSYLEQQSNAVRVTCEETLVALRDTEVRCPPLDGTLIGRYLRAIPRLRAELPATKAPA